MPRMPTKVEHRTKTTSSVHVPAVKTTTAHNVEATKKTTGPVPTQTTLAPATKSWSTLSPKTEQTTASADPSTLWSPSQKKSVATQVAEFKKLKPDEMKTRLDEIKVKRDETKTQVDTRVADLDGRWAKFDPQKKCHILRDYERHSKKLDRVTRTQIDGQLVVVESAQKQIDKLNKQVDGIGTSKKASKIELRRELKEKIADLKEKQQDAVENATAIIDTKGLKLDRLINTEKAIDPEGFKLGPTLGKLVDLWHELTDLYDQCTTIYKSVMQYGQQQVKQATERREVSEKDRAVALDEQRLESKRYEDKRAQKKLVHERIEANRIRV